MSEPYEMVKWEDVRAFQLILWPFSAAPPGLIRVGYECPGAYAARLLSEGPPGQNSGYTIY
jgi:hypothetical protein